MKARQQKSKFPSLTQSSQQDSSPAVQGDKQKMTMFFNRRSNTSGASSQHISSKELLDRDPRFQDVGKLHTEFLARTSKAQAQSPKHWSNSYPRLSQAGRERKEWEAANSGHLM